MATKSQIANFIETITPMAIRQCKAHGDKIFVSVCIAQACHESGYGTSKKMADANAVFGFKVGKSAYMFGSAWKGKAYKTGTTEYYDGKTATKITDWFRAYDSLEDSVCDYLDLLCGASRYRNALHQSSPEACINAIVKGGYATGPDYAKHIMSIIRTYHLDKYDPGAKLEYFEKYEGHSDSIVEALDSMFVPSTKQYRKQIYDMNFNDIYRYSAAQNMKMLCLLKDGKLIKP